MSPEEGRKDLMDHVELAADWLSGLNDQFATLTSNFMPSNQGNPDNDPNIPGYVEFMGAFAAAVQQVADEANTLAGHIRRTHGHLAAPVVTQAVDKPESLGNILQDVAQIPKWMERWIIRMNAYLATIHETLSDEAELSQFFDTLSPDMGRVAVEATRLQQRAKETKQALNLGPGEGTDNG